MQGILEMAFGGGEAVRGCCEESDSEHGSESETRYAEPVEGGSCVLGRRRGGDGRRWWR